MRSVLALLILLSSCVAKQHPRTKGEEIYVRHCTSCHNPNPKLPGTIGPEIFKTPRKVLIQKVLEGTYPDGYKPKRPTHIMPKFPQLKEDIKYLHIFLYL